MNNIIELLKNHKSIRKFKDEKVDEDKIRTIIESAQSASTSSFIQGYTIIRVDDEKNRDEIATLSGDQKYIRECPLFLVFCADLKRLYKTGEMNDVDIEKGFTEPFIIATVDAALAAQNAMVAAESMGLGGVYIGGIRNNPERICEILGIPENVYPVFGMCLGHPNHDPEVKPRLPLEVVFKKDRYDDSNDEEIIREYDEKIKEYYIRRTKGRREDTWSGQLADKVGNELRPHMKDFLEKKGFKMK